MKKVTKSLQEGREPKTYKRKSHEEQNVIDRNKLKCEHTNKGYTLVNQAKGRRSQNLYPFKRFARRDIDGDSIHARD